MSKACVSRIEHTTAALTKLKPVWTDISSIEGEIDPLHCHTHICVCLWVMEFYIRVGEKNAGLRDEKLPNVSELLV